jgi:hypothetical protein
MLRTHHATAGPLASVRNWLQIVKAEYREVPGLQLTRRQIQRMWSLDDTLCSAVLSALTEARILRLTPNGHYVRGE